ncbi:MAG: LD-carboxypeptidase [Pseudomonadota bacterium]
MFPTIERGSQVAVLAPAGPVTESTYNAGLQILASRYNIVKSFEPTRAKNATLPYLAADDNTRLRDFNEALKNPDVKAIFCARGGFGSSRLLAQLNKRAFQKNKIPLIGFSDITALHAWATTLNVPTVHGPVVTQLSRLPENEITALFELLEKHTLPKLTGLKCVFPGQASGILFGGNLTMLAHLCGTPWMPAMAGKILLLEEVEEAPYRLDRMLTQLLLSRVLNQLAGVVLGTFLNCDAKQGFPPTFVRAESVLRERFAPLGIPVVSGAPVGHGDHNVALPLGIEAHLDADGGTLIFRG